jgi:hypothetical protein
MFKPKENVRVGAARMEETEDANDEEDMMVGACTLDGMNGRLSMVKGQLYGNNIKVLRDTGCDGAILNKKFCPEDKYTGQYVKVRQIYGRPIRVPVAVVDVNTSYYKGNLKVAVTDTQMCDLIIGNAYETNCILKSDMKRE